MKERKKWTYHLSVNMYNVTNTMGESKKEVSTLDQTINANVQAQSDWQNTLNKVDDEENIGNE